MNIEQFQPSISQVKALYGEIQAMYKSLEVRKKSGKVKLSDVNAILEDHGVRVESETSFYYSHTSKKTVREVTYRIVTAEGSVIESNLKNRNLAIMKACKYVMLNNQSPEFSENLETA